VPPSLVALESPELFVDPLILGAAVVLAVGVVGTVLADRFRIPSLLLFLGLGMAIADDGLNWIPFDNARLAQNLSVLALVVILFDGGLSTRTSRFIAVLRPASALATVGVVVTAGVVAASLVLVFDVDASTAWLIGAVVASTDAAAVFAALRRTSLPRRLHDTLEAESGLNDPVAIMLTVGLLAGQRHSVGVGEWVLFGTRQIVLGVIAGWLVGVVGASLISRVRLASIAAYPVLAFATAAAAYGLAVVAGGSGFLAVYLAGVVLSERAGRYRRALRSFQAGLASVAQVGLFFLLGLLVFPSQLPDVAGEALFVAFVLALVARPLAVVVSTVWFRWPRAHLTFLSWAGLRGAVPIVLATFPLTAREPDGQLIFNVVFFVVLVSALVQGTTLSRLAQALGLRAEDAATAAVVELSPVDSTSADIIDLELTGHAGVLDQPLRTIPLPGDARIALVTRSGQVIVPNGDTRLRAGDQLVIGASRGHLDPDSLSAWLDGPSP
jgi:cell volume regulation protein A